MFVFSNQLFFAGVRFVCVRLRLPNTGQRVLGAQAGHKGVQEGRAAGHVGRQDQSADQEDHLSRTKNHLRNQKRLCCMRTFSFALSRIFFFCCCCRCAQLCDFTFGAPETLHDLIVL